MRVITGTARGRRLVTPEGMDTRPTTDKVKEAVCSSLQFDFPGAKVLDLFAGSGQMGIEALSRGARHATFIDSDPRAISCIQQNVKACRFSDIAVVLRTDAVSFLQRNHEKFDIAFLDPPYRHDTLLQILPLLAENMQENGIIVCEHEPECKLPQTILNFDLQKQKKYGKIIISVYRNASEAEDDT
ncbi:MAG: 16S rRNA (guanine(966)-N(2))-methyltransferase RsmD [Oscillospiraceae bacterium]|nr:16S rRNA (guanine(966)-N(2))-methyltransferase RsmD [Oscillospiraceae bacterium]MBR5722050.1 16S rRNA (guanine(966)-N(2))-methyltransferase RsmD [Oscillospiraceae bacterium]